MAAPGIRPPRDGRNDKGFTLVEMTIVVVLMGILMTLGMAVFDAQLSSAASSGTRKNQEILKDALIAYLRDNKRLPCPETSALGGMAPTGQETRQSAGDPTTSCASYWGTVPYTTLGLPRDTAIDGFGNLFTYFISSAQSTAEPDWTLTQKSASVPGFSVGNPGRFGITDNGVATTLSANLAVAAFASHGKNGLGAYTIKGTRNELPASGAEERTNAPDAATLPSSWNPPSTVATLPPTLPAPGVAALASRDRSDTFDDIVLAIRPNDLLQPLIKDGAIRSAEAQVQEALLAVKGMAVAQLLGNACKPVAVVSGTAIDPWGQPIAYSSTATAITLTPTNPPSPATTPAFRVWSYGPDRTNNNGSNDDRALPSGLDASFAQVRSWIPTTACP